MNREEIIDKIHEFMLTHHENVECDTCLNVFEDLRRLIEEITADNHSASPWHSVADGDFPLKAKNNNRIEFSVEVLVRLDKNRLAFGRYDYTYKSWYVGLQRVYPTHWMEIPKLPTE